MDTGATYYDESQFEGPLSIVDIEFQRPEGKEPTTILVFVNERQEVVYFPDRTLVALLRINGSTLRGRLNRLTKNRPRQRVMYTTHSQGNPLAKGKIVPGIIAINHLDLVNRALEDWVKPQRTRLHAQIEDICANFRRAGLQFHWPGPGKPVELLRKPMGEPQAQVPMVPAIQLAVAPPVPTSVYAYQPNYQADGMDVDGPNFYSRPMPPAPGIFDHFADAMDTDDISLSSPSASPVLSRKNSSARPPRPKTSFDSLEEYLTPQNSPPKFGILDASEESWESWY